MINYNYPNRQINIIENIINKTNEVEIIDTNILVRDIKEIASCDGKKARDMIYEYFCTKKDTTKFNSQEIFNDYFNNIYEYMQNVEFYLISFIEKQFFNNPNYFVHVTPLKSLSEIIENKKLKVYEDLKDTDYNKLFFSISIPYAFLMGGMKKMTPSKQNGYWGTAIIVSDLKNYQIHKRYEVSLNGKLAYFDTNVCKGKELDLYENDKLLLSAFEICDYQKKYPNRELFIMDDLDIKDIQRIYILSPRMELVRIYNNIEGESFQSINTEFLNDI